MVASLLWSLVGRPRTLVIDLFFFTLSILRLMKCTIQIATVTWDINLAPVRWILPDECTVLEITGIKEFDIKAMQLTQRRNQSFYKQHNYNFQSKGPSCKLTTWNLKQIVDIKSKWMRVQRSKAKKEKTKKKNLKLLKITLFSYYFKFIFVLVKELKRREISFIFTICMAL